MEQLHQPFLPPLDSTAPTAAETADIQTGFAQYYRVGQSITFTPPTITGYDTPTARTTTLGADNNTVTFTYTATSHNDGNDNNNGNDNTNGGGANNNNNGTNTNSDTSTLANTGADLTPWIIWWSCADDFRWWCYWGFATTDVVAAPRRPVIAYLFRM